VVAELQETELAMEMAWPLALPWRGGSVPRTRDWNLVSWPMCLAIFWSNEGTGERDVAFSGAVEAGEDADVIAIGVEGLEDGGDFVVATDSADVPVFGVNAVGLEDAEEAKRGTLRACGGGTGGRGGAGALGHDFELREGEHGTEAAEHGAAGDGLEFTHGFFGAVVLARFFYPQISQITQIFY